jgi:hypothetical protein
VKTGWVPDDIAEVEVDISIARMATDHTRSPSSSILPRSVRLLNTTSDRLFYIRVLSSYNVDLRTDSGCGLIILPPCISQCHSESVALKKSITGLQLFLFLRKAVYFPTYHVSGFAASSSSSSVLFLSIVFT